MILNTNKGGETREEKTKESQKIFKEKKREREGDKEKKEKKEKERKVREKMTDSKEQS